MNRRTFLKIGTVAGSTLVAGRAEATEKGNPEEFVRVLVDTTRGIGCRACERAFSVEHDLPVPDIENDGALAALRPTSETQWTVVNRFATSKGEVFVKKQCLHCWQPACAAACLTNAMEKTRSGPVVWHPRKCMGCRYCLVSCPFDIPKFEYHSWNPKIQKCSMCSERLEQGLEPACVGSCPTDALTKTLTDIRDADRWYGIEVDGQFESLNFPQRTGFQKTNARRSGSDDDLSVLTQFFELRRMRCVRRNDLSTINFRTNCGACRFRAVQGP